MSKQAFNYASPSSAASTAEPDLSLLAGLSDEEWAKFAYYLERVEFSAHNLLVRAGEQDPSVYILAEGRVAITADEQGAQPLAEFGPGDVFGEIAFLDREPRSAFVRALTDGRSFRLTREKFEYLSAWEPRIAQQFLLDLGQSLSARLRWTTSALVDARSKQR